MLYVNGRWVFFAPDSDATSKSSVNSMTFASAFTPISTGTESFATFAVAPMEAPLYIYMILEKKFNRFWNLTSIAT